MISLKSKEFAQPGLEELKIVAFEKDECRKRITLSYLMTIKELLLK